MSVLSPAILKLTAPAPYSAPSGTVYFTTTAAGQLTIDDGSSLTIGGAFTVVSPSFYCGSTNHLRTIDATGAVNIHTNLLSFGSHGTLVGDSVTIDDNGGTSFATTGLTITFTEGGPAFIRSIGAPLSISATASPTSSLTFTSDDGNGGVLNSDGDNGSGTFGVALSANKQIYLAGEMFIKNSDSSGNWVVTTPTLVFGTFGATLTTASGSGPATLAIHTNNLNSSASGESSIYGNGITIDDGGMATPGLTFDAHPNTVFILTRMLTDRLIRGHLPLTYGNHIFVSYIYIIFDQQHSSL